MVRSRSVLIDANLTGAVAPTAAYTMSFGLLVRAVIKDDVTGPGIMLRVTIKEGRDVVTRKCSPCGIPFLRQLEFLR